LFLNSGLWSVSANIQKKNIDLFKKEVDLTIADISSNIISEEELNMAKKQIWSRFMHLVEGPFKTSLILRHSLILKHDLLSPQEIIDFYDNISPANIIGISKKYLRKKMVWVRY
jgi:predicted Zn-dependent peptidase